MSMISAYSYMWCLIINNLCIHSFTISLLFWFVGTGQYFLYPLLQCQLDSESKNLYSMCSLRVSIALWCCRFRLIVCKQITFKVMPRYDNWQSRIAKVIWRAVPDGWVSHTETDTIFHRIFLGHHLSNSFYFISVQYLIWQLKYIDECGRAVVRFKTVQIPQIAAQSSSGSTVILYRLGDHVDISRGPLISTTQQLGRFTVTAVSCPCCLMYTGCM